jgi:two-component system cell cycle sensor histidine kinase/response regulator CckA
MVYGIVKQSGGSIQVDSETGQGSIFRIYLPAVEDTGPRTEMDKNGQIVTVGGDETILLAEDEPDLREVARMFLHSFGYRVLEASNAEQAIRTAELFAGPIHLLLTDVIMPGMSGRQRDTRTTWWSSTKCWSPAYNFCRSLLRKWSWG